MKINNKNLIKINKVLIKLNKVLKFKKIINKLIMKMLNKISLKL